MFACDIVVIISNKTDSDDVTAMSCHWQYIDDNDANKFALREKKDTQQ